MLTADVVVCGGGVIGCAVAYELSRRGAKVIVVERGRPGDEASGASAGMLAPQAEGEESPPFFSLMVESRELFPSLAAELQERTGLDVEYRKTGSLRLGWGEAADEHWSKVAFWQRQAGLPVERLSVEDLARREGGRLSSDLLFGIFFRDDAQIDPTRLTRALWFAAEKMGARFLLGAQARAFLVRPEGCAGVATDRDIVEAAFTVNAAGAWASFDGRLALEIPVRPARGQMVELEVEGPSLLSIALSSDVYLVPQSDGRVWIGSTVEFVGFEKRETAGAVRRLLYEALRLAPFLEEASFRRAWSGLRPATPDALPILGETAIPRLYLATGHFRNGILLAPITGRILGDLLLEGGTRKDISPYRLSRFRPSFTALKTS